MIATTLTGASTPQRMKVQIPVSNQPGCMGWGPHRRRNRIRPGCTDHQAPPRRHPRGTRPAIRHRRNPQILTRRWCSRSPGHNSNRQQFSFALQSGHLVLGVLTLLALATRTRVPTAVLTFLLGGSLLAISGYGLYLQVDDFGDVYGTSDAIQRVLPFLSAPVPLALATMLAAFLLRVNSVQPR